jgi:hypothetical protein
VQCEQADVRQLDGRCYRFCHGIWDVVEFQIEKNIRAGVRELLDCLRTFGSKELATDFKEPDCPAKFAA